jgi:CO dehydrogenase/acetyl-CoA synthase gamma subunit (corrinoid Fe-S protein)
MESYPGNEISQKLDQSLLVIPGLAAREKNAIRQLSRWTVLVGPVSGFLIPLFLWENELWRYYGISVFAGITK